MIDVGLYLQRSVVYAVQFENGRVVGSLARELALDNADAKESCQ